jgi:aspartate kinase
MIERGEIPVIAGFFIKDRAGNLLSLGRGGSDVTAFLAGKYLKCDEVIIVTDVEGVFSGDPRFIQSARIFDRIDADTLTQFAVTGAQVLHPNALRFKSENCNAKIVHYLDLDKIDTTGTRIEGVADTKISAYPDRLALLTLNGKNLHMTKGILAQISIWLADREISIHSITSSDNFVSIYLSEEKAGIIYSEMHEEFVAKRSLFDGLSRIKNVGEIRLSNYIFIESPGIISIISDRLSKNGINIIEMVTAHTDIVIYVNYSILEKTVNLLKERFNVK